MQRVSGWRWPDMRLVVLRTPLALTSIFPNVGVNSVRIRSASPRRRCLRTRASVLYSRAVPMLVMHLLPPLDSARQRDIIGILKVAAHGQAARQTRYLHAE